MGTSKSDRYLNTAGSSSAASQFAVVHSDEGRFTKPKSGGIRLAGGGHGEAGRKLLDKYHIEYHITHTYPNGVRIGNVPGHKDGRKRQGIGQSWFPAHWSAQTIKQAGEHVMETSGGSSPKDGIPTIGSYLGVKVGVILTGGKIATIFPTNIQ